MSVKGKALSKAKAAKQANMRIACKGPCQEPEAVETQPLVPWNELELADKMERLRAILFEVLTRTNLTSLKQLL